MEMPKRPGAKMREALEQQKREDMREYFESLQIQDVAFEIVDSKLLGRYEEQRVRKKFIYNKTWKIYEI